MPTANGRRQALVAVASGLAAYVIRLPLPPTAADVGRLVVIVLLGVLVLGRRNWSRWLLGIMFALSGVGGAVALTQVSSFTPTIALFAVVSLITIAASAALLFSPAIRAYARGTKDVEQTAAAVPAPEVPELVETPASGGHSG